MADTKKNSDEAAAKTKSATDKTATAAKAATDKIRAAGDKARADFTDRVVDPAKRAGEAVKASGKKVAEGGSTISARLIDQAETNARQAFAAMREAAKANDISEVMRVQGDYMRNQAQRSVEQAREIGELIVQFGKEAVTPLKGDAKK